MHPLGGVDHKGQRRELGERAGATDLPRESGREAGRESHQHRGGHQPARVSAEDAHPVRGGQRLRHQSEGRPALSVQNHVPDHRFARDVCEHHDAAADQRHFSFVRGFITFGFIFFRTAW